MLDISQPYGLPRPDTGIALLFLIMKMSILYAKYEYHSVYVPLAVPFSENGTEGDTFRNHGGHEIECDGGSPEDSKRSLPLLLPTMAGSLKNLHKFTRRICTVFRTAKMYQNTPSFTWDSYNSM
jgi:hypothetical protein